MILQFDDDAKTHVVEAFLREQCPEELKAEVQSLLAAKDWAALEQLMTPFYNVEP
jgi:hypothetical protein